MYIPVLAYAHMNNTIYTRLCNELEHTRIHGNPYWNAGPHTVELIISYIHKFQNCRMLEIGTSNGYTALRVAPALRAVSGSLVTIESHLERGNQATAHIELAELGDVITLVRGHAPEVCDSLTGIFDLIFLDATKYEHISYVRSLSAHMGDQCVIIVDNIASHETALQPFIDYMRALIGFSVEVVPIEAGILVAKKGF